MLARLRGQLVLIVGALTMALYFFGSLPVMLVTRSGELPIWFARHLWSTVGLWLAGARVEVIRMPALPEGPVIFASNHESALDIWVLFAHLGRSFRFMAKQELFRIPVFGWYLAVGGHIPVDRSNRARSAASLLRAAETVRAGTSLVVFAEGTRSLDGRVHAFKKGPFVIAKEAGVPVIPVAIAGSGAITPKKVIAVHPGTIRLAVGDPIDPRQFDDKNALLVEVRRRVIELHLAAGGLGGDPGAATARPAAGGAPAASDGSRPRFP